MPAVLVEELVEDMVVMMQVGTVQVRWVGVCTGADLDIDSFLTTATRLTSEQTCRGLGYQGLALMIHKEWGPNPNLLTTNLVFKPSIASILV
mmetsp:Transcript_112355/g.195117  ORF Transcript_112355/g.195117 Transcript_112355/m.195117 type:complete len:92 (-) Transcript_112355:393-668(-)